MKKLIITLVLCLFCVSPVFGFDYTGKWESGQIGEEDSGSICIKKKGNSYQVVDLVITVNGGMYRHNDKELILDEGSTTSLLNDSIQVNCKNKPIFSITPNGKSIKITYYIEDDSCLSGNLKSDDLSNVIKDMKWKRVSKKCK